MNNLYIYPYRAGSRSAIALSQELEGRIIRRENSKYSGNARKTVINWGSSTLPDAVLRSGRVLNLPEQINICGNKLRFFQACSAASRDAAPKVPQWTTDRNVAAGWFTRPESPVRAAFARTVLTGHSGAGIVELNSVEEVMAQPNGTLIVEYIPKRAEYRVHMGKTADRNDYEVISLQQKVTGTLPENHEAFNFRVRNHSNGFIFARNNVEDPQRSVFEEAKKAMVVSGLDFGAVDVIYNARRNESYVLEINTAPGLEGSTVVDYARYFNRVLA